MRGSVFGRMGEDADADGVGRARLCVPWREALASAPPPPIFGAFTMSQADHILAFPYA